MNGPNETDYIAYHGNIFLKNVMDSHKTGLRVQLMLEREDDYVVFKTFKKLRKGKAGTGLYRAFSRWTDIPDRPWYGPVDLRFVSWNLSSSNGAVITFELDSQEEWNRMRQSKAVDAGYGIEELNPIEFILVELDQEGNPVNVTQRAKIEAYERKKKWPKGGPQSKRAARLCNEIEFIAWVAQQIPDKHYAGSITTGADAADWVRKTAGLDSRAQLDHDPLALARFEDRVMKPFLRSTMH